MQACPLSHKNSIKIILIKYWAKHPLLPSQGYTESSHKPYPNSRCRFRGPASAFFGLGLSVIYNMSRDIEEFSKLTDVRAT